MWDDWDRERPADGSTIIWSWVIVALILVGVFAWSTLDQIMTNATPPVVANRDASGSGADAAVLTSVAPGAGPGSNALPMIRRR